MAKLILYQAKSPYAGDVTKNCALTGKEVDNNFLNLKGEDIEKIYLDEETKKLTFTRFKNGLKNCNGETIDAKIEVDLTELEYVTGYKYEDGVIKVTYSNGKTAEMSVEAFGMAVATDSTINGNGSKGSPLTISQAYRTGQYKPVLGVIDMTEGEKLPKDGVANGDGYVTKEVKSDFGMFYTSDQALMLEGLLRKENSEWRVPTKKDWDTLLNYLEDCDKYKNHSLRSETDSDARGMKLGNLAGFKVKSQNTEGADYWHNPASNGGVLRMYPTGSFSALSGAYSGFGEHAHFWTLTEGDVSCRNFYSKKFIDDKGTVTQIEAMPAQKLTIRLVKDFIGDNYHQFEEIHGRIYETKLFASESEECNQVWTMVNIDISEPGMDLLPTPMPEDATSAITVETGYYINRWNGYEWDKAEMTEGDCVVILGEEGANKECPMAEFRLECGELVNIEKRTQDQIDDLASASTKYEEQIEDIYEKIDELSGTTEDLQNQIDALSAVTEDLQEQIDEEVSARTEADEILQENIDAEASARTEADEILQENIDAEASARTEADEYLQEEIDEEVSARTEADEFLQGEIGELSGTTEELREDVDTLSATTEELRTDVDEISATTEELRTDVDELSATTQDILETIGTAFTPDHTITDVVGEGLESGESLTDAVKGLRNDVGDWPLYEESGVSITDAVSEIRDDIYALREDLVATAQTLTDWIDEEASARTEADEEIKDSIGLPSDVPTKAAVEYTDDDFKNGNITVFGFINASNDYGYNLEG